MINPFIQNLPPKKLDGTTKNDALAAEQYARAIENPIPRVNAGLWLGKLLIRMGEKLAKQDIEMKGTKQSA